MLKYIIYCRKSMESEDRQILSIESQRKELEELAKRLKFMVVKVFTESQSAKCPGRPIFNEVVKMINRHKADGIICWKLDRLARNPIDGGQIIWLIQRGIIKHIQTFDRSYLPEDNVLMMSMEFGMANQYILDLSKNVKRGLKAKAEKGWLPSFAPLGYLNEKAKDKGKSRIFKDKRRFLLVRKMWDLMLTGKYTPSKIAEIINEEWSFRSLKGKKISRSTIYKLFQNPFYCGLYEYPKGSNNWYQGKHEPMITRQEYDLVQTLFKKPNKIAIKKHNFPYSGTIMCGECGAMVTVEEKHQIICSHCKYKFSMGDRNKCPNCKTFFSEMIPFKILHYIYYHCTKRKKLDCSQRSININELEKQIEEHILKLKIPEPLINWTIEFLKENNEKNFENDILVSQKKQHKECLMRMENLLRLKISPSNRNGSMLSDEDFKTQKRIIQKELNALEKTLNVANEPKPEFKEESFDFNLNTAYWLKNGSPEEKTDILRTIGGNLVLKDKKLI